MILYIYILLLVIVWLNYKIVMLLMKYIELYVIKLISNVFIGDDIEKCKYLYSYKFKFSL